MMDKAITWVPAMDVYEMNDTYILDAELPGVERRDVKITFTGLQVTVRGGRKENTDCGRESYHMLEGHRGRFHRTFSLSEPIDHKRVRLNFKDGILHVVMPKAGGSAKRDRA